jgi:F-type H+-transporting ATPase subunit gamma
MVSAARLRRAQDRILAARPFAVTTGRVLSSLAARANPELHPLLVQREIKKAELILVTSDRGLCGSFNANAIKAATAFLGQHRPDTLNVMTIGRRGRDFVRRRKLKFVSYSTVEYGQCRDHPIVLSLPISILCASLLHAYDGGTEKPDYPAD